MRTVLHWSGIKFVIINRVLGVFLFFCFNPKLHQHKLLVFFQNMQIPICLLHFSGFGNRRNGLISEKRLMTPDTRQSYTGVLLLLWKVRCTGG